jgi:hypothetical protein
MARRRLRLRADGVADSAALRAGFDAVRKDHDVTAAFPPDVLAEAEAASRQPLPAYEDDLTDLPFLTIDPPGSMDLDQAMHLERTDDGFRVRYAIADVATFVRPGGAMDVETHRRGETLYLPDARTPLHPPACRRARHPCCPTRRGRRWSGPSTWTAAGSGSLSMSAGRSCAHDAGSTTRRCSRR